jgi:type IV fimbrial biogenesis protein FimT
MLTGPRAPRGFTLIEAMMTIAILSILLAMAAPALSTYSENSKVRGTVEMFLASAQQARLEAIRTNQRVELVLIRDAPTAANVDSANTSATAGNWLIRRLSDDATPVYTFVEGKNTSEGSGRSDGTSSVSISATSNSTPAPSVIFSSAGTTSLGAPWWVDFGSTKLACGSLRCLRVIVSASGQIKACDPAATSATDTRHC